MKKFSLFLTIFLAFLLIAVIAQASILENIKQNISNFFNPTQNFGETISTLPTTKLEGTAVVPRSSAWHFGTTTTGFIGNSLTIAGGLTNLATTTVSSLTVSNSFLLGGTVGVGGINFNNQAGYNASYLQAGYFLATSTTGTSILSGLLNVSGTSTLATTSVSYLTATVGGSVLGSLGIGTTTPYYSLDILARSGIGTFRIASSSAYNTLLIDNNGLLTFGLGDNSSTSMVIQEGSNTYLTFDTSNDGEKIVVGKNLEIGTINVDRDSGGVNFVDMSITDTSTAGTANNLCIALDGNCILSVYSSSTGNGMIENMRVGIGTTTPVASLSIVQTASTTGDLLHIGTTTMDLITVDSTGMMTFNGNAGIVIPHMQQSDNTDQAIASITQPQIITFDTDDHHSEITRTSSSRFTLIKTGSYLISFSGITTGVINETINVWLRKNGVDVDNSNTKYTFKSNGGVAVIAVTFIEHFVNGDYFEFWTAGSSTNNKWDYYASSTTPNIPATPSIIITANYTGDD